MNFGGRQQDGGRGRFGSGRSGGKGRGGRGGGRGRGPPGKRVCNFHMQGKCKNGDSCKYAHCISLVAKEPAHTAPLKALAALPDGTFFTGSADNMLNHWSWNPTSCNLQKQGGSVVNGAVQHVEIAENFIIWSMDANIDQFPGVTVGQVHIMSISDSPKTFQLQLSEQKPYAHPMSVLKFIVRVVDGDLHLITGGVEGVIRVWTLSAATGTVSHLAALEGHIRGVTCMVLQGSILWSGSIDRTICVWDMATMQWVGHITSSAGGHVEEISCMTLVTTPDNGEYVVSGGLDCCVKVWQPNGDLFYGSEETGIVTALGTTVDGLDAILLLVGLSDGKIIARSWKCLNDLVVIDQTVINHTGEVWSIKSCSSCVVSTGGGDGKLIVWNLQQPLFP